MNNNFQVPYSDIVLSTFNLTVDNKNKIFDENKITTNYYKENKKQFIFYCSICLSNFIEPCYLFKCRHVFCFKCIETWKKNQILALYTDAKLVK